VLLLATGFDGGNASQIRWHLIGLEGLHIHFDQADEWATVIGPLTTAAIDNDADAGDLSAVGADDVDGFLNAAATRDDVLGHDEPFVRPDLETAPENQAASLFLHKNVAFPERAPDFLADNDAAKGRGNDGIALDTAQLISEPRANVGSDVRVLQEQRTLEELPAVQAGAQNEMAVEQRPSLPEEREKIVGHLLPENARNS
jgi:hypothetical protein